MHGPQEKIFKLDGRKLLLRPTILVILGKKGFDSCYMSTMWGSRSQVECTLTLANYIWNVSVSVLLQQIIW